MRLPPKDRDHRPIKMRAYFSISWTETVIIQFNFLTYPIIFLGTKLKEGERERRFNFYNVIGGTAFFYRLIFIIFTHPFIKVKLKNYTATKCFDNKYKKEVTRLAINNTNIRGLRLKILICIHYWKNGSFFYEDEANSYHYPTAQSRVQITGEQNTNILRYCMVIWTVGYFEQ